MDNNTITILVTIVTALSSGAAWKFYEGRMKHKAIQTREERADETLFRDDLRERVRNLERLLTESNEKVIELTAEVHALRTEVQFLRQENDRLKLR